MGLGRSHYKPSALNCYCHSQKLYGSFFAEAAPTTPPSRVSFSLPTYLPDKDDAHGAHASGISRQSMAPGEREGS